MFALLATLAEAGPGKLFAGFISLFNLQTYGKRYIDARKQDKKVKSGKDKSKPSFLSNAEKKASMAGVIAVRLVWTNGDACTGVCAGMCGSVCVGMRADNSFRVISTRQHATMVVYSPRERLSTCPYIVYTQAQKSLVASVNSLQPATLGTK